MSQNAIELRGLKKTYAATKKTEAKTALSGIDLDIPRGSIFGLLGPNGAGKSTLLMSILGETQSVLNSDGNLVYRLGLLGLLTYSYIAIFFTFALGIDDT